MAEASASSRLTHLETKMGSTDTRLSHIEQTLKVILDKLDSKNITFPSILAAAAIVLGFASQYVGPISARMDKVETRLEHVHQNELRIAVLETEHRFLQAELERLRPKS